MKHVEAVNFDRFMTNGRTSPAIMGCEDDDGEMSPYIVKLNGSIGIEGAIKEFAAAVLADHFHIPHPPCAFVTISSEFADAVALSLTEEKALLIKNSVGPNFGSFKMNNLSAWPVDRKPNAAQEIDAASIFAFDVLIQNPDRRATNPNLGTVADELRVFDHELAFGFLDPLARILALPEQWRASRQGWLNDHALLRVIPNSAIALLGFTESLRTLPPALLSTQLAGTPPDWQAGITAIEVYLNDVRNNTDEFIGEVVRRLA